MNVTVRNGNIRVMGGPTYSEEYFTSFENAIKKLGFPTARIREIHGGETLKVVIEISPADLINE